MKSRLNVTPYLYILPALTFVGLFLLYPMARTIAYSFTDYRGLVKPEFIGLENYVQLFKDPVLAKSLTNTLVWVLSTLAFPVIGGLAIATGLRTIRLSGFYKSIVFLPYTISFVTTGIIWGWMFAAQLGVVNGLLDLAGLEGLRRSWLSQYPLNTASMIIAWTWQSTGVNMVLFLMGLTTLPVEPIEAATLDGARGLTLYMRVVLPMLRPITTVVVGIALINSFKVFDLIYVMTGGGPARSSEVLAVTMFRESFTEYHMGYGAAVSVFLSILVLAVSIIYVRQMAQRDSS